MKLHLGCGSVKIDGFVNIDIRYLPTVDKVDNIRFLRSYEKNSIELIYASHVLEHISRWDVKNVLVRWYELLKDGGILRIAVPDFNAICSYYKETKNLRAISGLLYGGQDYEENFHKWIWDFETLKKELKEVGFKDFVRYNWRFTEHHDIDDCSQAYIPHLDKEHGRLMSLNFEAIK